MTILLVITIWHKHTGNMTYLPSLGLFHISETYRCQVYSSPTCNLISRSMTEFSSTTQIKLNDAYHQYVQVMSKHVSRSCFLYFHGSKFDNRLLKLVKNLNLVKVHIECAPSSSILDIPMQKLKQENAFKFESLDWY